MIKLAFIKPSKSYAPEIYAYFDYFSKFKDFSCNIYDEEKLYDIESDFILCMPGVIPFYKKLKAKYIIFDYATLSTGRAPKLKNIIKRFVNKRAHINVFLNPEVRQGYFFMGQGLLRDMGVSDSFFAKHDVKNKIKGSVVYCGSICKARGIEKVIDCFVDSDLRLYLIGRPDECIVKKYKCNKNIIFLGEMTRGDIAVELPKYEFGLNYVPDKYPFNIQTATKVLEYSAAGLKVISNKYYWIKKFEKETLGSYFYFQFNKNLTEKDIRNFDFKVSNVMQHKWGAIIEKSSLRNEILKLSKREC